MNHIKRNFFVLAFGLLLGTAITFAFGTECRADNEGDYGFFIVHADDCECGNKNVNTTVILGSTHKYVIMPHEGITFASATWGFNPESLRDDPNITFPYEDIGKTIIVKFTKLMTYTFSPSMYDTENNLYHNSISINVVTENFNDEYLNICAKKGETVSITPQFLMFSEDYPDGALTTITEDIEWNTSSISSMNPDISNGTLTFTPDQSGEYSVSATYVLPYPDMPNGKRMATTHYTIFVPEKEVNVGQSIPSIGQQNEYVSFTPNVTGRYKINWKSHSNSGNESLYDSKGNQVLRMDDYLGGYWLTAGETYCMKLYYKTPTNSNSYSIDLYTVDDDSTSTPGGDGDSSNPAPTPSVPSGQPSQGISVGGSSSNSNVSTPAPAQKISVAKMKGKPKLKLKKGKIKVTFKKVTGAKGYEIRYATNKKFKKSKKVTVKSPKATLKKLKKGKKYFVKVRAYKLNSASQKVYGAYSKVVKITVR